MGFSATIIGKKCISLLTFETLPRWIIWGFVLATDGGKSIKIEKYNSDSDWLFFHPIRRSFSDQWDAA